jgi:hypothetical protein
MLVPPNSPRVVDRIRYWARANAVTLTELGMVALGARDRANARRPFSRERRNWRPHEIDAICAALRLDKREVANMHRLAVREMGWRV